MDLVIKNIEGAEAYTLNVFLESLIDPKGASILPYHNDPKITQIEDSLDSMGIYGSIDKPASVYETNTKIISTLEDINEHFKDSDKKYFIKGKTDSKFSLLDLSYTKEQALLFFEKENKVTYKELGEREYPKPGNIRVNKKITISGTDITGMILLESNNRKEYVLYLDTPNPVFYIDNSDGTTIFKFMRNNIDDKITPTLNYYSDIIDEPKILSEVFIDRGITNAFEPMRKLKNINNLNELTKSGFGYYKINTRGYNFKDQ